MPSKPASKPTLTPEQFMVGLPSDMQALANELRALIRDTAPEADEAVYTGWGVLGYRIYLSSRSELRRRRVYWGFVHPTREYVSIGFEWGVLIPDPDHLLEGDDLKQVRFITLRRIEEIPREALTRFIQEAVRLASLPTKVKHQLRWEQQEIARLAGDDST